MSKLTPGREYERKFLVRKVLFTDAIRRAARQRHIRQGYLAIAPAQVRVRHIRDEGYILEIKGKKDLEIECGILPDSHGRELLEEYAPKVATIVSKVRHAIPAEFDGLVWEVDLFEDDNAPLMMAEIEMPSKDYPLLEQAIPAWVGDEVTGDPRFKNKHLAIRPFKSWLASDQEYTLKRMGL